MIVQIPLKFILAWFLIITITYSVCGFLYTTSYDSNLPEISEPPQGIIETIASGIGWLFDFIIGFFRVVLFILPNVPTEVMLIMNIIIQPFNIIFLIGVYPIIADFIDKVINFLEAIIPL